mmetsp:Transcript_46930/g.74954  ORF Transcript_46930/g.74954 Transcript_46930/m.74954 type:complete len:82 (+) Transcript_46930:672-917(+)
MIALCHPISKKGERIQHDSAKDKADTQIPIKANGTGQISDRISALSPRRPHAFERMQAEIVATKTKINEPLIGGSKTNKCR